MTRTEILNGLAEKHQLKSYLEIGVQNKHSNFEWIICPEKQCVDPDPEAEADFVMTSDDFFSFNQDNTTKGKMLDGRVIIKFSEQLKYDLIFIDGLHHADQVEKDIINSMKILNPGGFIVVHDCNPLEEWQQLVPRQHKVWYGDVWRAFAGYVCSYPHEKAYCHVVDCGCGVIPYTTTPIHPGFTLKDMKWEFFDKYRVDILNLV